MPTDASLSKPQEQAVSSPEAADGSRTRSEEISMLDIVIVLAERKYIVAWFTAGFAIVAVGISLLLPPRYTASVTLLPPQQNSSMAGALAAQLGNMGGMAALAGGSLGLKNPNDHFVGMLKSRTVEDAMVQHFGLMQEYHKKYISDARKAFENRTTVDGSGKDGLIHVSVEDGDPNRAATLANGYVDQFRNLSEHLAITEAAQRRLFFERQLEQAKNSLADAEEALKLTEQKTGMIQLDSQARALIASAASLRAEIAAKEVQIESMRTFATAENSQMVQAQNELEGLRAQLAKMGGSEPSADESLLVPGGRVPAASLEYVRKLRDVKYNETIFDILARQFEIAKLDEAKEGATIQVVDPAVVPDKKSYPRLGLILAGALIAGLIVGIAAALAAAAVENIKSEPKIDDRVRYLWRILSWKRQPAA
jgi:uncharacterized protein involved in exopolysaccharide biosynthesis